MPRYVIERQYLVPVYEHILVEAPSLEEAYRQAIDEEAQPWGDDARTDYECARAVTIERAVELPMGVPADSTDDRSLSHFLYDAGLIPLSIPPEFADQLALAGSGVGFV